MSDISQAPEAAVQVNTNTNLVTRAFLRFWCQAILKHESSWFKKVKATVRSYEKRVRYTNLFCQFPFVLQLLLLLSQGSIHELGVVLCSNNTCTMKEYSIDKKMHIMRHETVC